MGVATALLALSYAVGDGSWVRATLFVIAACALWVGLIAVATGWDRYQAWLARRWSDRR